MNHDTVREKLLDLAYGELSEREASLVEAHLAGCDACRAERERIAGTRAAMRRLEPVPAPERGERVLLAAARQAAERRPGRRPLLAPWIWRVSLTTALVAAVGLVSYRVISLRERSGGEAQGEAEKLAGTAPGREPEATFAAPPPAEGPPPAEARPSPPRREAKAEAPAIARAARPVPAPPAPSAPARKKAEAAPEEARAASRAGPVAGAGRPPPAEGAMRLLAAKPATEAQEEAAPEAAPAPAATGRGAPVADAMKEAAPAAAVAGPEGAPPATPASGRRDPRLRAIRQRVEAVERDRRQGRLAESIRSFERCGPGEDAERRIYRDGEGRVAKYVRETGRDDASLTFEQTYDRQGRLRYVLIHGGATNGTVVEHRVFLDESGQRLLEEQRIRRGPGYPFPSVWPERDLTMSQPEAAFGAAARCPEIGAGGGR